MESYLIDDLTDDDKRYLFESDGGPLSSFHGKILIGFAIGMYGPATRHDLLAIKRIRNAFAHAPRSINFDTPEIISECTRLSYLQAARENIERHIMPLTSPLATDPKEKFFGTVKILHLDLHAIGSKYRDQLGG